MLVLGGYVENSLLLYCLEDETASFIPEFNGSIICPQTAALILELESYSHFTWLQMWGKNLTDNYFKASYFLVGAPLCLPSHPSEEI